MSGRLTTSFYDGDIEEHVLREVWRLRLEMVTLHRSEEEDWEIFEHWASGADRCLFVFRDKAGAAQGFFTVAFMPLTVGWRRMLLMYSKYFYFRAAWRGNPSTLTAPWRLVPYVTRRYGPRSLHFVTTSYPQSYVSLARTSGKVFSLADAEPAPDHKRAALEHFASQVGHDGFDPRTGLIATDSVAESDALPRSPDARILHEAYLSLNPRWREGFVLPILFSVDGRLVLHSVRRFVRRRRRVASTA